MVERPDGTPQLPGPSLWPIGFALGIVCTLVGLIGNWVVAGIGAALTIVFGFLWVRDATGDYRGRVPAVEPERRRTAEPVPAHKGGDAMPKPSQWEAERFPRNKFLEGATLGLGAVIGGMVTVPAIGFAIGPAFLGQETHGVDVGAVDEFPEGEFVITTFPIDPDAGEVALRTAYVRNNGQLDGQPSFTIVSSRCVHLGCPVQPNGPINNEARKEEEIEGQKITRTPSRPIGFGCPCHGGQYDTEGNRTAGPPVRALDRYEFSIRNGRLWLGRTYSVGHVEGAMAEAKIYKYPLAGPGEHVDGPSAWLYPVQAPH